MRLTKNIDTKVYLDYDISSIKNERITQMKKWFKKENGSMTVYVIVTIFSFMIILTGVFFASSAIRKNQLQTISKIKEVYEQDSDNIDQIYEDRETEETVDITTLTQIQTEGNVKAKDIYGNKVTVPKGFKVVISEGTTVPQGIVIEDASGNQFVWIPVGIVYKNAEKTEVSTIKLGRYTFNRSDGTPTMQQAAFAGDNESNPSQTYASAPPVTIQSYYQELTTYRPGTALNTTDGLNATTKNLKAFVDSVADNGGYYIARYEASYGSGYNSKGNTDAEKYANAKPLSKASTTNSTSSMTYDDDNPGQLWNFITQLNASKVSQNMYANNMSVGVESDLVNSYVWDTAIVFIQEMENNNYANANRVTTGNSSLMNTGETGDKVCNIFDMAANVREWTTEYSTYNAYPCTYRGGQYGYDLYTMDRTYNDATFSYRSIGFRVLLYVK